MSKRFDGALFVEQDVMDAYGDPIPQDDVIINGILLGGEFGLTEVLDFLMGWANVQQDEPCAVAARFLRVMSDFPFTPRARKVANLITYKWLQTRIDGERGRLFELAAQALALH